MRSRHLLFLLALGACSQNIRSTDPQNWIELQSDHFSLRTDLLDADAREAIYSLELVRSALLSAGWHSNRMAEGRTQVVELASSRELHEFSREGIDGYVMNDAFGEPLMVVSADREILEQGVLKHELAHVINAGFLVSKPRWIDEGLACYLETLRFDRRKNQIVMGEPSADRLRFLQTFPVQDYYSVISTGREFEMMSAQQGYQFETGAWLIVHWLVDTRPEKFDAFLTRLARGQNVWVAFSAEFPDLNKKQVSDSINQYLKNGGARLSMFPMPTWSGPIADRHMSVAEVHALRAELIKLSLGTGSKEERNARAAAEASLALAADPGNPLALQLNHDSDGKAAVEAHPDDWRSWVLFHDHHSSDRASIEKAAKLAPDNAGVLFRLAFSDQNASKAQEAMQHAVRAVELAPGRADAIDALAQIEAAQGRCQEALDTEQRAIDAVPDAATIEAPTELRKRLNQIANHCGEQPSVSSSVLVRPELKSCVKQRPRLQSSRDVLAADFTIHEDGAVSDVSVRGNVSKTLMAAFKRFLESCKYNPVLVEGKPRSIKTTLELRAQ